MYGGDKMDKHVMIEALRKSINNAGIAIMNDNVKLKAFLSDFLPGFIYKNERIALLHALDVDEWKILLDVHDKGIEEHERVKKVLLTQLQDIHGWTKERSSLILECYTTAMGWEDVTILQSQSKEDPKSQLETQPKTQPQTSTTTIVLDDETRELLEFVKQLKNHSGGQLLPPPQSIASPPPTVVPSKKSITVAPAIGSIYKFGAYDWRVLDVQGDRVLLVSKDIIAKKEYSESPMAATWEICTLRKWLNEDFLHKFSEVDQSRIVITTNINENNQWSGTNGGRGTQDRIFLLSISEVVRYFGDSGQLKNRNPKSEYYIQDQFNSERIAKYSNSKSWWWLRSPGCYRFGAALVNEVGELVVDGNHVHLNSGGVRPALWINL
jgi:hypothetical protein